MSTATTQAPTPTGTEDIPSVPLSRLLRTELRKTTDTRAGKWLLIAIVAVTALVVVIVLFAANEPDLTYETFVTATGSPQGYLLPVLGILAITSEWSQRTGLVTFTLEPSRTRVFVAKFAAVVLIGLMAIAVAFALAALGNVVGATLQNGDGSWHYSASWVAEIVVGQLIGIIEGLGFGLLLLNSAAAIVVYFVAPLASTIVFNLIGPITGAADWLDINTASQPLFDHTTTAEDWAHIAVACAIWIGLPIAIGLWRLTHSEVK